MRTETQPLGEDTVKVSDHVWQIVGWPNIGIVVGEKATLVVDTGLGPAMVRRSREWRNDSRPATNSTLTTTHFHPEHAGGVAGFPEGTILIRPKVQQDEMDKHGVEMIQRFSGMNPKWKELLADAKLRPRTRPLTENWNWISEAT